jgi:hypothetical protein
MGSLDMLQVDGYRPSTLICTALARIFDIRGDVF